jgi:hypothetical protein
LSSDETALIRDVSNIIKDLIIDKISELSTPSSVVFDSPGDFIPSISQDQISLFLYQISENQFLKNQDLKLVGSNKLHSPPICMDLYYLLTPYVRDKEMEQIILAKLIRLFYDNQVLSGPILGDNLLDSGNEELRIVVNNMTLEQINHLWGMFPGKAYRLGLYYIVTPLLIPSTKELGIQRVITKQLDYYSSD